MCGGLTIMALALFVPMVIFIIWLAVATFLFLTLEVVRLYVPSFNSWLYLNFRPLLRDEEASRLTGASYIFIAALLLFLLFEKEIALVALAFLAIGDPLATIVGNVAGKTWFMKKTIEGDLACLLACLVVGFVFYCVGLPLSIPAIIVGAIVAAAAEAVTLPLNDNITIPLFAAGSMALVEYLIVIM